MSVPPPLSLVGVAGTVPALISGGLSYPAGSQIPAPGASILPTEGRVELLPSSQELPTRPRAQVQSREGLIYTELEVERL